MPAKRPTGARNETVECEYCGERYAITYKRCPFCDERPARRQDMSDDQPTIIFRRPTRQELEEAAAQEPPRRGRREAEDRFEEPPPRRLRRDADGEDSALRRGRHAGPEDEYEDEPMRRFVPAPRLDDGYEDDRYDEDDDDDYDDQPRSGRRLVRGGQEERRRPLPQPLPALAPALRRTSPLSAMWPVATTLRSRARGTAGPSS